VLTSWWAGVPTLPGWPAGAGHGPAQWAVCVAYAASGALGILGFGGLTRGRTGRAWVLALCGRYRGTVRRTGLTWVNPLLVRHRVDVRLRHWHGDPVSVCDADGLALSVTVLVTWRVRDTARAVFGVEDHQRYLRERVEAALARVVPQVPADASPARDTATLRNVGALGDSLTRLVAAEAGPAGLEVCAVQPTRIAYAPEVAARLERRRTAELDARHRDAALTSVADAVEDMVTRLTARGLVAPDDYERAALVRDLTVAFADRTGVVF
jgi:regulator of protease activity HflC (stomatin/prohibitin superfamily)